VAVLQSSRTPPSINTASYRACRSR
jgi:hypothetical protein